MSIRNTARATAALVCAPLLALSVPAVAGTTTTADEPVVLAEGLAGPLGLAVTPDGTAYVAQQFAGLLSEVSPEGEVSVIGQGAVGGVDAKNRGTLTVTLATPPEQGAEPMGAVARLDGAGRFRTVGSPLQHELDHNPDGDQTYGFEGASAACLADAEMFGFGPYQGIVESNPYAVLIERGDRLVADAAGNSIVRVRANKKVSTVAVLPPVPTVFTEEQRQALIAQMNEGAPPEEQLPADTLDDCAGSTFLAEPVPTDVEHAPDGSYYVSSLPGFPEAPGSAAVYRVTREGAVTKLHDGFSGAVDLAVADDGTIYVAELFGGQLTRVSPDGSRDSLELDSPGAVEVGDDGSLYVTTGVFGPGSLLHYEEWPTS